MAAAQADYERAIELDETLAEAYLGLADVYIRREDYEKAQEILQIGLEKTGDSEIIADKIKELEVTFNSAALNTYGATEFTHRSNYYAYDTMTETEKQVIGLVGEAVINNRMETLYDLLDKYSWDMFSFSSNYKYTMWNGYKMKIMFRPYNNNENGDCCGSVEVKLRAENGTGYVGEIYHTFAVSTEEREGWWEYYYNTERGTCPCVDWQWNGGVNISEQHESLWHSLKGTTSETNYNQTEVGTMKDNLRNGTFTKTRHIMETWLSHLGSDYNDHTDKVEEQVLVYNAGVLIKSDGVRQNGTHIGSDILGIGWGGDQDQYYRDNLFW